MVSRTHTLIGHYCIRIESTSGAEVVAAILAEGLGRDGFRCAVRLAADEPWTPAGRHEAAVVKATRGGIGLVTQVGTDMVIVLDEGLLVQRETLQGLSPEGIVVINSERSPGEWRRDLDRWDGTLATVAANRVAGDAGSDVALPLVGAAARASGLMEADTLYAAIWAVFDQGLPYAARAACLGFTAGYEQVRF